jgi:CDP-diacylglycerol---serine O-phosphatidyltransferase
MNIKSQLPNLLTLANLFFGCCAIVCIFNNAPMDAFWFLVASFLADAADGQVARALKVSSPLGKELDSIADTVSFAAAPGMMLYVLLCKSFAMNPAWMRYAHAVQGVVMPALPAFLVTLAGAYRLAKYNIDTRQSDKFIGVPTPANTLFVMGLWLVYATNPIYGESFSLGEKLLNPYVIYSIIPVLAYWQVAEIPLMNFRFDGFGLGQNKFRYLFLILALVCMGIFGSIGLSLSILLYVAISMIEEGMKKE